MNYFLGFLASFGLAVIFTLIVKWLAIKFKIVDQASEPRKQHGRSVPLLGGAAIFLAAALVLFFFRGNLVAGNLEYHHWLGVLVGAALLIIGGALDDKYNLKPSRQIIWPILAALAVIAGGVGVEKITSPFSGLLFLNDWQILLWTSGTKTYYFVVLADLFALAWLLGMIYTTKLLDGLDGLVGGVAAIASLIIFLFTTTTRYYQPDIALAAVVLAGACLGFLIFNWHPAKIFLGEGGSTFLGFALGVLSIISGGKIAIALLIMGIPILDVAWTMARRARHGQNPFKTADRKHLHFRLLDTGWGQRRTVLTYYLFAAAFGLSALFLQSVGKLLALLILAALMLGLISWFTWLDKKKKIS